MAGKQQRSDRIRDRLWAWEHAGWQAFERRTRALIPTPPVDGRVPEGRMVELPGRGRTFVVDVPGPSADAPVVVLLHALICTAYLSWGPAFADLSDYRVIALDQRWHGRGIRSPRFTLDDCADDVDALLDELGVRDATLVGYSLGGAVAQLTWRRHPQRVNGLVLCSTAETFRGSTLERWFFPVLQLAARPLEGIASHHVERVGERLPTIPALPAGNPRTWAAVQFRSTSVWSVPEVLAELGRFDSAPWIGGVDVPTSVVVTAHDHAVPPRQQRALAADIRDAAVFEAPAGHAAQGLAYPVWSRAFLAGVAHATG